MTKEEEHQTWDRRSDFECVESAPEERRGGCCWVPKKVAAWGVGDGLADSSLEGLLYNMALFITHFKMKFPLEAKTKRDSDVKRYQPKSLYFFFYIFGENLRNFPEF